MAKDRGWEYLNLARTGLYFDEDNDGSTSYENDDGSGDFYGNDDDSEYYSSDDDSPPSSGGSWLGALVGAGIAFFAISKLAKLSSNYDYEIEDDDEEDYDEEDDEEDIYESDDYYSSEEYQNRLQEEAKRRAEAERRAVEEQRLKKEQRQEKRRRIWGIITCKKLKAGISSISCRGLPYEQIVNFFDNQGFFNIATSAIEDLSIDRINQEGTVEAVSINRVRDFDIITKFPLNAKIEVIYHKLQRAAPPMTSGKARKRNINEVETLFYQSGFNNVSSFKIADLRTGWLVKDGSVEAVSIEGRSDYEQDEKFRLDAHIVITYHTFKNKR